MLLLIGSVVAGALIFFQVGVLVGLYWARKCAEAKQAIIPALPSSMIPQESVYCTDLQTIKESSTV